MDNNVQDVNDWGVDSSAKAMSVHELFVEDIQYMIPLYQRNYDWTTVNVLQLLEDVRDKAITASESNYYIGTLVVYPRREYGRVVYEVIDGQQRLTTLTLLLNAIKQNAIKQHVDVSNYSTFHLSYEHRDQANEALCDLSKCSSEDGCVKSIEENFRFLKNKIKYWNEPIELNAFVQYLLQNVMIARVEVPQGTDLNHYFEIMNTRGEQLEMHEVLKARLMSPLNDDTSEGNNSRGALKRHLFNVLWEACSDMNNYVQMNFRGELLALRKELFGENYDKMPTISFDDLLKVSERYSEDEAKCINDFLDGNTANVIEDSGEKQDNRKQSYCSLLSFPSFLLHVLKVMLHQKEGNTLKVTLDDKTLISTFGQVKIDETFSKEFIMSLVKIRFLFDKYIIKREYIGEEKEDWSLERLKSDGNNVSYVRTFNDKEEDPDEIERVTEDIRMLQSMFQVSFPTQNYKYWVYAILNKVYVNDSIKGVEMRNWLYRMACAYMVDGYLKQTDGLSIESITNQDDWVIPSDATFDFDKINKGCAVENYVFNFYDYVIWKYGEEINPERVKDIDLNNFKFTYRSSVEHFYPQLPIDNNPSVNNVDDFGNLCLISSSMNSRFNNLMPASKYDSFGNKNDGVRRLSLKLNQMFKIIEEKKKWDEESIKEFGDYARNVLREGIKRGGDQQNNN